MTKSIDSNTLMLKCSKYIYIYIYIMSVVPCIVKVPVIVGK